MKKLMFRAAEYLAKLISQLVVLANKQATCTWLEYGVYNDFIWDGNASLVYRKIGQAAVGAYME